MLVEVPPLGFIEFDGLVEIEGTAQFSHPGDSGSLVTDVGRSASVAMLVAGDGSLSYATPLSSVLAQLQASIVSG